ncbi:hypothetical protein B0H19DRAFT_1248727 [Mycena capillaripes]|nr:hypothetical protein B0H19DRAFT_1248727 [Mycena capillaripes]
MPSKSKPRPHPRLRLADIPPCVPTKEIRLYHHGYKERKLILQLVACPLDPDGDLANTSNYALPYDLVLKACALLANNEHGTLYKSSSIASLPLKVVSRSTMLMPGEYPLCPKFSHWRPGNVPELFLFNARIDNKHDFPPTAASAVSDTVKAKDEVCVLTGGRDRVDLAHLVLSSAARWFVDCNFNFQAGDTGNLTVNSPNNQLVLRTDINSQALDVGNFCFFPYEKKWDNNENNEDKDEDKDNNNEDNEDEAELEADVDAEADADAEANTDADADVDAVAVEAEVEVVAVADADAAQAEAEARQRESSQREVQKLSTRGDRRSSMLLHNWVITPRRDVDSMRPPTTC